MGRHSIVPQTTVAESTDETRRPKRRKRPGRSVVRRREILASIG